MAKPGQSQLIEAVPEFDYLGSMGDSNEVSSETDRIRDHLHNGLPWVMMCIVTRSLAPTADGRGHAVVATGSFYCQSAYIEGSSDQSLNVRRILVYDPNLSGKTRNVDIIDR